MGKKELAQFVEKYVAALNSQVVDEIELFHAPESVSLAVRAMNQKMQKLTAANTTKRTTAPSRMPA